MDNSNVFIVGLANEQIDIAFFDLHFLGMFKKTFSPTMMAMVCEILIVEPH